MPSPNIKPKSRPRSTPTPKATAQAALLRRYAHVADGIAALFSPHAEVVIHDLHTQTVAHLANNLSRRELGDDSGLEDVAETARKGSLGPYEKLNWDGRRMRCVSTALYGDDGSVAGIMCINFSISVFEDMRSVLDMFIKGAGTLPQPPELFKDDWQERINTFLHGWLGERHLALNTLTRDHRRELVEALYAEGAFKGKSAANYVASVLGMGRATVYKHLKELKTDGN